ncbi:Fibronectin-binding A domain protein [Desulfurispirillum indicum S5]|uniref:Rqc2 homolog RqcH n=1 Tax=Desulfurispirillum indicum (strain ATCC BAA-1389 / DSM 22839 / S5) TaxID=653733 RepID=E6W2F0_DESIS|nr:NFACT family protein [Desulfurispirillum indicum]ADU66700.1 Fibronectin-binding A domain protein [Desulfurispirillum indicum S5]
MDYPSLVALAEDIAARAGRTRVRDIIMVDWHQLFLRLDDVDVQISAHSHPNFMVLVPHSPRTSREYPFARALETHLKGTYLLRCSVREHERILRLSFGSVQGQIKRKFHLVVEIMGRHSNVILLDEDKLVLAALKENWDVSTARPLLTGQPYQFPPSQGRRFPDSPEDFRDGAVARRELCFPPWLIDYFCRYPEDFPAYRDALERRQFDFARVDTGGKLWASVVSLPHARTVETFDSVSAMVLGSAVEREESALERRRRRLVRRMEDAIVAQQAKMELLRRQLEQHGDTGALQREAQLIKDNLHRLRGGGRVRCHDYVHNTDVELELPRDILPRVYMEKLFRRIRKYHLSLPHLQRQLEKCKNSVTYLEQERYYASYLQSLEEVLHKERELFPRRGVTERPGKRSVSRERERVKKLDFRGYLLYVGLSSAANEKVTFGARPDDWWFHAKDIPGAHVVLACHNRPAPDEESMAMAAALAAFFCRNSSEDKVSVDYTQRKHVRKPAGTPPGTVYYTHFKTLLVGREQMDAARRFLESSSETVS